MKIRLFILLLFLLTLPRTYAQNTVLIYLDHSNSVNYSKQQEEKETALLRLILTEEIKDFDDQVIFSYLYENTASVSNQKTFVFASPYGEKTKGKTKAEILKERSLLLKTKFRFIDKVLEATKSEAPKSNSTHILTSLVRISELAKESKSLRVVYLSDMVEHSGYRNLIHLSSRDDAVSKAQTDAQKISKDFDLVARKNTALRIDCFLPVSIMEANDAYQYLPYYWQRIFADLLGTGNLTFHTL